MKPLGLGAIGSGEIAINSIFKHLILGDTADKVYMAAVCDPVPGRAEAMAKEYGIKKWYMTDDELLADPDVDAVSICSPIRFHYEQGLKAIRAGKHVHFNKTMAMTSAEATELLEEAARMNVKMVGSDPGICAELNGGTHMSFEDMAIMRNIPGMVVCEPVDSVQLRKLFGQIVDHEGPVYMRLFRKAPWKVFDESAEFTLGKACTLKKGRDATVFATGIMVKEALDAAETLAGEGVDVEVVNIHTLKPLDTQAVLESVARTGCCVTAENAFAINGLGSAVAEAVCESTPVPVVRVGVEDEFGEVGPEDYLRKRFELTADKVYAKAKAAIAMKK